MSGAAGKCTVLLATYNRPQMLAQQLRYLDRSGFEEPVHIFDSSEDVTAKQNAALAAAYPAFAYTHLPPTTRVFSKFAQAFSQSDTPYSVLLPDDDFLMVGRVPDIVAALEADRDAAAAHGLYFEYHTHARRVHVTGLIQSGAHLDQARAADRVVALMTGYEALTYAVCRTDAARIAFAEAAAQESVLAQELLAGTGVAAFGKVLRLPFVSHGRRAGSSLGYRQWHPLEWSAVDPAGLFAAYGPYRTALIDMVLKQEPHADRAGTARSIDLGHLAYLSHYLDADVLSDVAFRDLAKLGSEGVVEVAWDVWAGKRGPAWLKPLRNGNPVSRGLRRAVRRMGLRYLLSSWRPRDSEIFAIADADSKEEVRLESGFLDDPLVASMLSDSRSDLKRLTNALALRESTISGHVDA